VTEPYLSVVVAARNDNYGGDFIVRMQGFVDSVMKARCRSEDAPIEELVIVEWNPPAGKPLLKDVIEWPNVPDGMSVRIITVPSSLHHEIEGADRMPMFEYIAKNAGIRRAMGRFVLVTNPDNIFSSALLNFLDEKKLGLNSYYRVDRFDVSARIPLGLPPNKVDAYCLRHTSAVQTEYGPVSVSQLGRLFPFLVFGFRQLQRSLTAARNVSINTNASGDFLMMSKEHWRRLRGYPELRTSSYIDGLMCHMAASAGLMEVTLAAPKCIFHQEHDRSELRTRPRTDYGEYKRICATMLSRKEPIIGDAASWGLGSNSLPELVLKGLKWSSNREGEVNELPL
jgi:hypothetical protein